MTVNTSRNLGIDDVAGERAGERAVGARSLATLTSLLLIELRDNASPDEAHGFLKAIGTRLADGAPMPSVDRLDMLAAAMNEVWRTLDWGQVRLEAEEDGIGIVHFGAPSRLGSDDGALWPPAFASIIEGAYDGWFRALGSGPKLVTSFVARSGDRIELRHGR